MLAHVTASLIERLRLQFLQLLTLDAKRLRCLTGRAGDFVYRLMCALRNTVHRRTRCIRYFVNHIMRAAAGLIDGAS